MRHPACAEPAARAASIAMIAAAFLLMPSLQRPGSPDVHAEEPAEVEKDIEIKVAPRDYSTLGQPAVAAQLQLTDRQRAAVARLLDERVKELVAAPPADRESVLARSNQLLADVLTDPQREAWANAAQVIKLQFNFREQPWPDVLDWFARQGDLSLVMDSSPPGTFTYSDTKTYAPTEAIDLLNSVLLTKGFTLIRRERMLLVADTSEGLPFDMVPRVTIDELAARGRYEYVTVAFPLGARPVDTVLQEVQGLLGAQGRATPLGATKQLLVTATAGKMETINRVIASIAEPAPPAPPAPKPPGPTFASYPVPGLDAEVVAESLRALFKDARVTPDANAEQVHVYAIPDQQAAVQAAIHEMERQVSGANKTILGIYPIHRGELSKAVEQIRLVLPEVQTSEDTSASRLLVVATEAQQEEVHALLTRLELASEPPGEGGSIVVYDVDEGQTSALDTLLREIVPRAKITTSGSNILVFGSGREQELARAAITQFRDAAMRAEDESLRFYPVDRPLDVKLLDSIRQLIPKARIDYIATEQRYSVVADEESHARFASQLEKIIAESPAPSRRLQVIEIPAPVKERFESLRANFVQELQGIDILANRNPGELSIVADTEGTARLHRLLESLRTDRDDLPRVLRRFPLDLADPNEAIRLLQPRLPTAELLFNSRDDELLIWCQEDEVEQVNAEVEQVVAALPKKEEAVLATYPAEERTLAELQTQLGPAVRDVQITWDESRKQFVVWATPKRQQVFRDALARLESESTPRQDKSLEIYPIRASIASELLAAAQGLVPTAEIRLGDRNERLWVVADPDDQVRIATLVTKLMSTPEPPDDILLSYRLEQADPLAVVAMLQAARPDVTFAADERARRILVTATLEEHTKLRAIIEQLDSPADTSLEESLRTYEVKSVNPALIVTLLEGILPRMKFTADDRTRSLAARGNAADQLRLEQVMQQMEGGRPGSTVRTFDIGAADPDQVRNVLNQLTPRAVISADPQGRQILVWATDEELATIESAMKFFGANDEQSRALRSYELPTGMGSAMLTAMRSIVPRATVSLNTNQTQLICWGTEEEQQHVADALEAVLSGDPRRADLIVRRHEVSYGLASRVTPLLQEAVPNARILTTTEEGDLLVWATPNEHERITQLIESLEREATTTEQRIPRAYHLEHVTMSAAREAIDREVPATTYLDASDPNQLVALASPAHHAVIARIVAELEEALAVPSRQVEVYTVDVERLPIRTIYAAIDPSLLAGASVQVNDQLNSLIVRGTDEQHQVLRKTIDTLAAQLPDAPSDTARVYRLTHANPETVRSALQQLLPRTRLTVDGERLVATGPKEEHTKIDALLQQLDTEDESEATTVVYRLDTASARRIRSALTSLVPQATITFDDDLNVVVATAGKRDHDKIDTIIRELNSAGPDTIVRVFRLTRASARSANNALSALIPRARVSFDQGANVVVVTGSESDVQIADDAMRQIEGAPDGAIIRVYPFDADQVSAQTVADSLDPSIKERVAIQVNEKVNSLVVRGSKEAHTELQAATEAIIAALPEPRRLLAHVYPLQNADPNAVRQAIQSVLPPGGIASPDLASRAVVVSAFPADHERIQQVIAELDTVPVHERDVRAYTLQHAEPRRTFDAVREALRENRDIAITVDEPTRTLFVAATEPNHRLFRELLNAMDRPAATPARTAQSYRLEGRDGGAVESALRSLFAQARPPVEVRHDGGSRSVLVVGTARQHLEVESVLASMEGEPQRMEVFTLRQTDPYVVQDAIEQLFADAPRGTAPSVSGDDQTRQLFIRGTTVQVEQIRTLLAKMGEPVLPAMESGTSSENMRSIPFDGNIDAAVAQLLRVWPRIRTNRIQVVAPSHLQPATPSARHDNDDNDGIGDDSAPANDRHAEPNRDRRDNDDDHSDATETTQEATREASVKVIASSTRHVAFLDGGSDASQTTSDSEPSIVVIPDRDQITIASSDTEALDQLESLLRAMARDRSALGINSNFAIYLLRNTGARQMEQMLNDLFDEIAESRIDGSRAVFIADERLNALIVHATRRDREVVDELLQVLDTEELPDRLVSTRPELIPLKHTEASRVLGILQTIYKTQLSTGGGRQPLPIPDGVSSDVALLLQQINAASSGPLLTLGTDETTNSIVMRAPPELGGEIRAFAERLDRQAAEAPGSRVRVVRLHESDAERMESVLQQIIKKSR